MESRPADKTHIDLALGVPERDLTPAECWAVWQEAYARVETPSAALHNYRVIAAWRITRKVAMRLGLVRKDQPLSEIEPVDWTRPDPDSVTPDGDRAGRDVWEWGLGHLLSVEGGLALVPPEGARGRERFAALVAKVAQMLHLERGSKLQPNLGHYGLDGMTDPALVGTVWPSRGDILAFEESLVDQVAGMVLKWSKQKVIGHLKELLGLDSQTAHAVVDMSIGEAKRYVHNDVDVKRALMEGRLEDYIERARDAGDLNNEMKGLKMLATVGGLTRTEPESGLDAIVGAIAKVAQARAALPAPDAPRVIVNTPGTTPRAPLKEDP